MSLVLLTIFITVTSPWFLILVGGKSSIGTFYIPGLAEFFVNLFNLISFDFLFFIGDGVSENSIPEVGVFYLWQLPFLLLGFYWFAAQKKKAKYLLLLILTIVIGCFFAQAPNILYSVPFLLVMSATIGQGLIFFISRVKKTKKILAVLLVAAYLVFIFYNTFFSIHQYQVHYPKRLEKLSGG